MVGRSFRILALFIIALNLFTSTADAEESPSADFDANSNRPEGGGYSGEPKPEYQGGFHQGQGSGPVCRNGGG